VLCLGGASCPRRLRRLVFNSMKSIGDTTEISREEVSTKVDHRTTHVLSSPGNWYRQYDNENAALTPIPAQAVQTTAAQPGRFGPTKTNEADK
jgi:hypothetical protein